MKGEKRSWESQVYRGQSSQQGERERQVSKMVSGSPAGPGQPCTHRAAGTGLEEQSGLGGVGDLWVRRKQGFPAG